MPDQTSDKKQKKFTELTTSHDILERLNSLSRTSNISPTRLNLDTLREFEKYTSEAELKEFLAKWETALAVAATRSREDRQKTSRQQISSQKTGVRSLVSGPSYSDQFLPDVINSSQPGSIEDPTSGVGFLYEQYQITRKLEAQAKDAPVNIPLASRRSDISETIIDNDAYSKEVPVLKLNNQVLKATIQKYINETKPVGTTVDDVLAETYYPFGLPYERYQHQINYVLDKKRETHTDKSLTEKNGSLGDMIRTCDIAYPWFKQPGLHSDQTNDAQMLDTFMGPAQAELLLEKPFFPASQKAVLNAYIASPRTALISKISDRQKDFYKKCYGVETSADLVNTKDFCIKVGISHAELESLLSIEKFMPVRSDYVSNNVAVPASPTVFGSVFINAGKSDFITIETISSGTGDDKSTHHILTHVTDDSFDRMQRILRLSRWLNLSFEEVDQLLMALLRAENPTEQNIASLWPTQNTLRGLGLFQRFRKKYDLSAAKFAAIIDTVSVYARGDSTSQLDTLFRLKNQFDKQYIIDNSEFYIVGRSESEQKKIALLCAALGIDNDTFIFIGRLIAKTLNSSNAQADDFIPEKLTWSIAVISAFYRVVTFSRGVSVEPVTALALLSIINDGGQQFLTKLCRVEVSGNQYSSVTDTFNIMDNLADAIEWCQSNQIDIPWLYHVLLPVSKMPVATDQELNLVKEMNAKVNPTLITEKSFSDGGVLPPESRNGATKTWMQTLSAFIDDGSSEENIPGMSGLVKDLGYMDPLSYQSMLATELAKKVSEEDKTRDPDIIYKLSTIIMSAKANQEALVWETFSNTFSLDADQAREVLFWSGGNFYQVLKHVIRIASSSEARISIVEGDAFLSLVNRISKRAEICQAFNLSAGFLQSFRSYPRRYLFKQYELSNPNTSSAQDDGVKELDFITLYSLACYATTLKALGREETLILNYLQLASVIPGLNELSESELQLYREDCALKVSEFTGFAVKEIIDLFDSLYQMNRTIVTTMEQLAFMIRLREAKVSIKTGVRELIALAHLTIFSDKMSYRNAAEAGLSSLGTGNETTAISQLGELGQTDTSFITVDKEVLIAIDKNKYPNAPEQVAVFTVKLLDPYGNPRAGIQIRWQTTLGKLRTATTRTDENGVSQASLSEGSLMGEAKVTAIYSLERELVAPSVMLTYDQNNLVMSTVGDIVGRQIKANGKDKALFTVSLKDIYGNVTLDEKVSWSTDKGKLTQQLTSINEKGESSVYLTANNVIGNAQVFCEAHDKKIEFYPVLINDVPYVEYVKVLAVDNLTPGYFILEKEYPVECRLLRVNGEPLVNEPVEFGFLGEESGIFNPVTGRTDIEGRFSSTLTFTKVGSCVITVKGEDTELKQSESVNAIPPVKIVEQSQSSEAIYTPDQSSVDCNVTIEPKVANYPIQWLANNIPIMTTVTDSNGTAKFTFTPADYGKHQLQAKTQDDDAVIFTISKERRYAVEMFTTDEEAQQDIPDTLRTKIYDNNTGEYFDKFFINFKSNPMVGLQFHDKLKGDVNNLSYIVISCLLDSTPAEQFNINIPQKYYDSYQDIDDNGKGNISIDVKNVDWKNVNTKNITLSLQLQNGEIITETFSVAIFINLKGVSKGSYEERSIHAYSRYPFTQEEWKCNDDYWDNMVAIGTLRVPVSGPPTHDIYSNLSYYGGGGAWQTPASEFSILAQGFGWELKIGGLKNLGPDEYCHSAFYTKIVLNDPSTIPIEN
ncbi:Tc toxin subunit A [Xenorhabdus bovienii]|uniref:Tc toxin subunit A n=1 Tax=Xenorhabdus bovienii TaxID=40576 RepID=UPI001EDDA223|nr:Ig-like domain-containing protein [Xenorhabdus bovienii]MCG3470701.1 Tc toxin subunit A [Xenorhabdus bovienii]